MPAFTGGGKGQLWTSGKSLGLTSTGGRVQLSSGVIAALLKSAQAAIPSLPGDPFDPL